MNSLCIWVIKRETFPKQGDILFPFKDTTDGSKISSSGNVQYVFVQEKVIERNKTAVRVFYSMALTGHHLSPKTKETRSAHSIQILKECFQVGWGITPSCPTRNLEIKNIYCRKSCGPAAPVFCCCLQWRWLCKIISFLPLFQVNTLGFLGWRNTTRI